MRQGRLDHCLETFLAEGVEAKKEVRLIGSAELFKADGTCWCFLNVVVHD